jgi:hypothetical protein
VWNGPGSLFGARAAAPKKNFGPTLNIVERPPISVGTGFTKRLPTFRAGSNGISIRWCSLRTDSGTIARSASKVVP